MESNGKRYIRNDSANCAHIVEDTNGRNVRVDPHERLRALLNAPDDDTDDLTPPPDAPKFGTVIHNRIFVGGFSLTATDEDLWKFFSGFASVTAARVIYDRAGVSKCYGFVTFASPKHARLIVKQSGGVMFSPLGRLRIAQAVRKQMSQLPMLGEVTPQGGPFCYQLLPYAPYPPPALALYPVPYEGAPMYAAAPPTQYTLVPAGYSTPMQPGVQLPRLRVPARPAAWLHLISPRGHLQYPYTRLTYTEDCYRDVSGLMIHTRGYFRDDEID